MMIFVYTFVVVFIALIAIFGVGSLIAGFSPDEKEIEVEGKATAAMCTTQLLGSSRNDSYSCDDDFVIEQDMVFTYDSFNL